jgi:hypothetical protein
MTHLAEEWIVGLGLLVLVLALGWERWFPGLTDSQPEVPQAEALHAPHLQRDLPPRTAGATSVMWRARGRRQRAMAGRWAAPAACAQPAALLSDLP